MRIRARAVVTAAISAALFACAKPSTTNSPSVELGSSTLLAKDVSYRISGTDLTLTNRGARMSSVLVDGDPDREDHVLTIHLELRGQGAPETFDVTSSVPHTTHGLRFSADPLGFQWGKADGAVMVERAP